MAGIVHFKLDCFLPSASYTLQQQSQNLFKLAWDFFKQLENAGYCTEIARNNGNAATFSPKALGTGFHDELTPFGESAWAVFKYEATFLRSFPYYVLIQWSDSLTDFGAAPGNPGTLFGLTGIGGNLTFGISMATAFDSSGNPSNPFIPASGSMGSHIKSDPVWTTPPGGTLFVFPLSNNTGGGYATSKQNMLGFSANGSIDFRFSFIADKDNWIILQNRNAGFTDTAIIAGGFIITASEVLGEVPLFLYYTTGNFTDTTVTAGDTAGTLTTRDGGASCIRSRGVRTFSLAYDSTIARGTIANLQTTPSNSLGFYPISVEVGRQKVGWADPYFWRVCNNLPGFSDLMLTRTTIGISATHAVKLTVPWDGTTERNTNFTRDGVVSP